MKSIRWVEEEIFYKSNLLNLEYNENINKKIDEYSNLLRMYNHDFKNILVNIKDSIEIGDIVKAKEIISEFDGKIHSLKNYNKKFSNNSLINALLNRLSKECEDKDISFDFDCYIPDDIGITELDLLNIFNNLSSNAYEACSKQYCNEKRWIIFKSYVKDKNFIIYQANSFNGEIKYKKDRLITTKENKRSHGIGVESIKHIVNEVNGMALVKVDKEKREFKFLIKIPDYE
ncbi:GHKL domain-containing protein [Clostridium perfringens]|nr:GHKL domain-containing protein [Clostridium perfringens]HAT4116652.1 sensor histidine kinase [Clostridium perfringens]